MTSYRLWSKSYRLTLVQVVVNYQAARNSVLPLHVLY